MRSFTRLTLGVSSTPSPRCTWSNHPTSGSSIKPRHTQPRCLHATRPVRPPSDTPSLQRWCDDKTAILRCLASFRGTGSRINAPLGILARSICRSGAVVFAPCGSLARPVGSGVAVRDFLVRAHHCVDVLPNRAWLRCCSSVFCGAACVRRRCSDALTVWESRGTLTR